jgi:hypothetical protein
MKVILHAWHISANLLFPPKTKARWMASAPVYDSRTDNILGIQITLFLALAGPKQTPHQPSRHARITVNLRVDSHRSGFPFPGRP